MRHFSIGAAPDAIFPLLCPVREYEWIPSWSCQMAWSESGVAELNAIFHTRGPLRTRIVWTLVTYDPPRCVEYLLVAARHMVVRLSISLVPAPADTTEVTWKMLFTATSSLGKKLLASQFSEEKYGQMIQD
ncbi:MAG TPA: SRPBCC family protein, partial [Spirochaetia bacterium]|nr:SRPBCC family protein [Spirochaetia bacterium]